MYTKNKLLGNFQLKSLVVGGNMNTTFLVILTILFAMISTFWAKIVTQLN